MPSLTAPTVSTITHYLPNTVNPDFPPDFLLLQVDCKTIDKETLANVPMGNNRPVRIRFEK